MKLFLNFLNFLFLIFFINTSIAQTQYPAPQQDLSQANLSAQIPSASAVMEQAQELTPYGKFLKVYRIYDPFYDTWDMKEAELENNRYYIELKMKHFNRGGEGEALAIFKRRADKVRELKKMGSYEILEFNERIENQVFYTRRIASGIFEIKPEITIQNYDNPALYFPAAPSKNVGKNKAAKPATKQANKNPTTKKATKKSKSVKPKTSKTKKTKTCNCCDCCDNCKNNNKNNQNKNSNSNKNENNTAPKQDADSWNLNDETKI